MCFLQQVETQPDFPLEVWPSIHPSIWMDDNVITVSEVLILSYLVPKYLDATNGVDTTGNR